MVYWWAHVLWMSLICVFKAQDPLNPGAIFIFRNFCGHQERKTCSNTRKERMQNKTNQKLLVSAWGGSNTEDGTRGRTFKPHNHELHTCEWPTACLGERLYDAYHPVGGEEIHVNNSELYFYTVGHTINVNLMITLIYLNVIAWYNWTHTVHTLCREVVLAYAHSLKMNALCFLLYVNK